MAVGTIGSFAIIVLANQNNQTDQARVQELTAQYQEESEIYQAKVDAQATELSNTYYSQFSAYESRVSSFDAATVTELKKEDLLVGEGEALTSDSSFTAYYIGWNPSGETFDSSIDEGALKAPLPVTAGGVIEGWTQGIDGMKVGGVRELTIPSDLAYGETGSGDLIPANTPLKFIVMVIPDPEKIVTPAMPEELLNYYQTGRLQ